MSRCVHPLQLCTQHIASAGHAGCALCSRCYSETRCSLFSFLVCPAEVVTVRLPNSIVYANISWPTASPGLSALPCPCHTIDSTALAYRRCLSDGTWLTSSVSECVLTVDSSVCALVSEGEP